MSLSWRKRQAKASDQKTWRGLGVDSALWTSIDRNAGNVKASLGNSGSSGVVTGLKFVKTEGMEFTGTGESTWYVSDASNSSVVSKEGVNQFDTAHPPSNSGSGLIFTLKKYDTASTFGEGTPLGTDISGMKYYVNSGGSGYNVGDDIIILGVEEQGYTQSVQKAVGNIANPLTQNDPLSQDAYKVFDISATPSLTVGSGLQGQSVELLDSDGDTVANGIIAAPTGVTAATPVNITIHSLTTQDFLSSNGATLGINGATATNFGTATASGGATLTSTNAAVNGFSAAAYGAVGTIQINQTVPQYNGGQFKKVFSAIKSGSTSIIPAAEAGLATVGSSTYDATGIRANPAPTTGSALIKGRLAARVTSIANTSPEAGRN